jgi:exodeoxyribonuclease V alpha subunit
MGTNETNQIYKFKIIPIDERFYNEDSSWGVFNFTTTDDIPELKMYKDPFELNAPPQMMSTIAGKMQRLYLGAEYNVTATLEHNKKYDSWQYAPISITANMPKDYAAQLMFLKSMINESVAENLLKAYPNIVEDVASGKCTAIDYDKVKGVREYTWNRIKEKIIDNYVISDIIIMLQPLGVTYTMIKKLLKDTPNPTLLKQELDENPYIMVRIKGLGFRRVDELALKLKPELKSSMYRLVAFVKYYLTDIGEQNGHTWITIDKLKDSISDYVPECMDYLDMLLSSNTFLHIEGDRIGLKSYRKIEEQIFSILKEKTAINNPKFNFTDAEIETAILQAEREQGFQYIEEQRDSIYYALRTDVSIISGKAGVGKSTISRAILNAYKNREMSISAMALSAKAAQRISEATGLQATTIHRGLGAKGLTKFTYDHDNPLPCDVVFVDEASMINARLFYDFLSAIGENTRLIISGDHAQLPPLGYGCIFSDILSRIDAFTSIQLTKVMRQAEKSGILSDANKIRDGINPIKSPELKIIHGELQDMYYMFRNNREALRDISIKTFMKSIETDGIDEVVIAVPRRQDCINSANEINKLIQDLLVGDNKYIDKGYIKFHLGAKVRQTVNNYEKNIFNGEIGYITDIYTAREGNKTEELCDVTFKDLRTGENKLITYTKNELDELDLSYAMTVHALQGSGYKTVIGIIDNTHYSLLDTCLLYTLITRAKKRCLLLAESDAFLKCLRTNNNTVRQTWMKLIEKEEDDHCNIIVAGSRTFTDYNVAKSILNNFISTNNINSPTIISGMANGADMLGYNFAKEYNLQIKECPADWDTYQKRAGYIRNEQMAKYASENGKGILIAFWDGESNGTKHMIELAKKYKLEIHVFDFKGEEYGQ